MLAIAVSLTLASSVQGQGASSGAQLYTEMSDDTRAKGRAVAEVFRTIFWLGRQIDECVLVAAPNDQDWEGDYLSAEGSRWGLKIGFDDRGEISFLSLRLRSSLPDDPHIDDQPLWLRRPVDDRPLVPFSGGPTRMWNQHVVNPDQRHAVDLVSWKDGGSYGTSTGESNEDYAIWDAPIRAPLAGTVVATENGVDDHKHPQKEWQDEPHPFGNYVVIQFSDDRFVVLGHMKKGSVAVQVGQQVWAGAVVGHVGNSGNSSEPHLHVHVQDTPALKDGVAVSVPFVIDAQPVYRGSYLE